MGIEDGLCSPDPNMAIATAGREAPSIRGNMAAVNLKVFLLAAMAQPRGLDDVHGASAGRIDVRY